MMELLFFIFGSLLIAIGLIAYFLSLPRRTNRNIIRLPLPAKSGIEVELNEPAFFIIIVGAVLMVVPYFFPLKASVPIPPPPKELAVCVGNGTNFCDHGSDVFFDCNFKHSQMDIHPELADQEQVLVDNVCPSKKSFAGVRRIESRGGEECGHATYVFACRDPRKSDLLGRLKSCFGGD